MRGNRRTDTNPELALRRALHAQGRRFRKGYPIHAGDLNVRVDVVSTRARLAVFIDGCFWHLCPDHRRMPTANRDYWESKLGGNPNRDREITGVLRLAFQLLRDTIWMYPVGKI